MHFFSVSDRRYCFDEVTRNCFQVDQASEDALRIFEASGRTVNSKLLTKSLAAKGYDQTTIAELEDDIDEYQRLSERTFLTKDTPRKLRSIELHVSHACNLGCSYCFAGKGDYGTSPLLMTDEIAFKAVDYLVASSSENETLAIVFFGGEPMINEPLIWKTVDYSKRIYPNRNFTYSITTNGTLLNDTAVNSFKEHGFSVLISLDGTGCKHDASRPYKTGGGSFSDIDKNVRRFSESFPFGARATLTNNNCNLVEDYLQFKEMGFRRIYFSPVSSFDENIKLDEHSLNKIRAGLIDLADQYLKQIDQGEKPLFRTLKTAVDLIMSNRIAFVGCGAGRRFISVTPEGDVYPCHRFVGMMRFKMGNIVTGIDETRYIKTGVRVSKKELTVRTVGLGLSVVGAVAGRLQTSTATCPRVYTLHHVNIERCATRWLLTLFPATHLRRRKINEKLLYRNKRFSALLSPLWRCSFF